MTHYRIQSRLKRNRQVAVAFLVAAAILAAVDLVRSYV
jgi:hypothetical protein